MRITRNENLGWRFVEGDPPDAAERDFDDGAWRVVDLPHDFMIEQPYDRDAPAGVDSGFLPGGVGWYRKRLDLPATLRDRRIHVEFDGIMANGRVFVNGENVRHRPNGYVGFGVDVTDQLRFDGRDVLAVRADTSEQSASRWYTGSGIYRDVRLVATDSVRVVSDGIFVRATSIDDDRAVLAVDVEIGRAASDEREIDVTVVAGDGADPVAEAMVSAGTGTIARCELVLPSPRRWSPDDPHLYRVRVSVQTGGDVIDRDEVAFGVRAFGFDRDRGFLVNDRPVKLKGVCLHHDQGPLGAKCFRDSLRRRFALLQRGGCNAVRCSHNPMSRHFYDLCDRMGLLVIDEIFDEWRRGKRPYAYHRFFDAWWRRDLTDQLRAHRNHACIIAWSIGNEIPEKGDAEGARLAAMLRDACHELDPTRPVTAGCEGIDAANRSGFASALDVVGVNGGGGGCFRYDLNHRRYPARRLYASEVPHTFATRGVYRTHTHYRDKSLHPERFARMEVVDLPNLTEREVFDREHPRYASSYDNALVRINVRDSWSLIAERDFMAGEFRWTGVDYLGESHGWPAKHSNAGIIDLCGFAKDPYHLYRAMWTAAPMVHLLPHWTHPGKEGVEIPVFAYSNCDEVELFVSGESAGRRRCERWAAWWPVPYAPGRLDAKAYRDGAVVAESAVVTAGAPAAVRLASDRSELAADRMALLHVEARIVDADGVLVPRADPRIDFTVSGAGEIIAVGAGDPISDEPAVATSRRAFNGMALCIVRATGAAGDIEVVGEAQGLERGRLHVPLRRS